MGRDTKKNYALIDSGDQQKLERFGPYLLARPCSQAVWRPCSPRSVWSGANATFSREGGNRWNTSNPLPESWVIELEGLLFKIAPTEFGHLGIFPEHSLLWSDLATLIQAAPQPPNILNLFAYSGGATLAAARAGAKVCHLDASKGMVAWARENAALNGLSQAPIRWIIDDVVKFLKREEKRGSRYDGIILDPPSFGRGNKGEVFKIEDDLHTILSLCRAILQPNPLFVLFTTHTPGMTPLVIHHLLTQMMQGSGGKITAGELVIPSENSFPLPYGGFGWWRHR